MGTGVQRILEDTDFKGFPDISGGAALKGNSQECASHCVNTSRCTAAVYDGKKCYPKSVNNSDKPATRTGHAVIVPQGSQYPCMHSPAHLKL